MTEIAKSSTIVLEVALTHAERDTLEERQNQRVEHWDEKNVLAKLTLDQYIGISLAYVGRATCASRNDPQFKRDMLMKGAAMLLQAMDRIDDGVISLATPAEFGHGTAH